MNTSIKHRNRKLIEGYEPTGDGSLADTFMRNAKQLLAAQDAMTPAEKRKQTCHYKKKMAEIVTAAKNHPGYDAIFPNPKDASDD